MGQFMRLIVVIVGILNLGAGQAVEVIRAIPQGESVENIRQITLTFNQKMVPLGRMERTASELGITITPAVQCQWRWLDATNLTCQLADAERLRPANAYTLTVNAGLRSESGAILPRPYVLQFSTARPKPTYTDFRDWRHPSSPRIQVSFNQEVHVAEAVKLLRFDSSVSSTPAKLVPPEKGPQPDPATHFVIEPRGPLAADTDIQLKIANGLRSASGPLTGSAQEVVRFRTFPAFRFLGISCANLVGGELKFDRSGEGECNPLNGVRLRFSVPVHRKEVREQFKITPALAAKGKEEEVWGEDYDDSYALRRPHQAGQEYTVHLPRFLLARKTYHLQASRMRDAFDRRLDGRVDFQFRTSARSPSLYLRHTHAVLEKNEKTDVPLYVTNLDSLTFNFDLRTSAGVLTGRTHSIRVPKLEDISFAVPMEARKMTEGRSGVLAGIYSSQPNTPTSYNSGRFGVQITPFQVVAKAGHQASLVWVTDLGSGNPVAGARVRLAVQPENSIQFKNQFVEAKTDANGLARLSGYPGWPRLGPQENYVAEIVKGSDIAILPFTYLFTTPIGGGGYSYYEYTEPEGEEGEARGVTFGADKWNYIHAWGATAQGVYKPGEKVQFKFYVRSENNRHYGRAPSGVYNLKITDPKGDEVFKQEKIRLNEFGAFASEFKLSPAAAVGWYTLNLYSDFANQIGHPVRFLVADFTPVPYKVDLQLMSRRVRPGDNLKMDSFATLHAGGPFAKAPIRLVGQFQPRFYQTDDPALRGFTFDSYDEMSFHRPEVLNHEAHLDDKGHFPYEFRVPKMHHHFGTLTVEAAVQDDRGKNSARSANVEYSGLDRRVGLKQASWSNKVGEKLEMLYAVVNEDGKPAPGTAVTVQLERQETKLAKVKGAGNAYLNKYTSEWVKEGTCQAVAKTEPGTCAFVPKKSGSYRATASIQDSKGRPHKVENWLYVVGPGYITWEMADDQRIEVIPEKKDWKVGEKARFLVKNPFPGARALISVERIGVMKAWTQILKDSIALIEVPIESDFVPGFHLSIAITSPRVQKSEPLGQVDLGKPAARFGVVDVQVSDPFKQIEVLTKTVKSEYRPREKVRVDLTAKVINPRAPAEKIELAVVVLDEAVLNLIRGQEDYFNVYRGFYDHKAWDVFTYNLINMLVGRQKFEKKGANAGGGGGLTGPISMRDIFKYVAYWNPSLRPDKSGKVGFGFTLPDNLTGWRVLTMAVTPTDRMGLGQYQFKVNKPTEIRPVLPNQVTEGDRFRAGFSVFNRTDKTRKVAVRIAAEGLLQGGKAVHATHVELSPFQRQTVFLDVQTSSVRETRATEGSIVFKVAAGDAADRDGLVHKLDVLKKRSIETAAIYGTTTENQVSESILFPKDIHTDVGSVSVTLAPSVIANVEGSFKYIRDYPHLCWEQKLTKATMASHYLRLRPYVPGVVWPEASKLAQATLDEAANFQAPNGGMTYWTPSDAFVSPYLSAYTAVAFVWLREAGYRIPQTVEERLHAYLQAYLRGLDHTTFFDEGMRSTVRAVALYALSRSGKIDASEIKRFAAAVPSMSLFGQAHYLLAALNSPATSREQNAALRVILNKSSATSGKFMFNETLSDGYAQILATPIRDNCAVLSSLLKAESAPELKNLTADIPFRLVRSLTQSRGGRDYFQNTQENLFCLQALIDYSKVYEKVKPAMQVRAALDGKDFGSARFDDFLNPIKTLERFISASDPGRKAKVTIERQGQGRLYYATRISYSPREEKALEINSGMDVRREYYVERGGKWQALASADKLKRGELVRVDLFVSIPTARNFVAISDPVPGGLEPVNRDLADASVVDSNKGLYAQNRGSFYWKFSDWREFDLSWGNFYHQELRHSTVRYYADYLTPGNYRLSYTAQAIATGEFYAGPTHGEEMYDPDVFGKAKPARFVVEEKP